MENEKFKMDMNLVGDFRVLIGFDGGGGGGGEFRYVNLSFNLTFFQGRERFKKRQSMFVGVEWI